MPETFAPNSAVCLLAVRQYDVLTGFCYGIGASLCALQLACTPGRHGFCCLAEVVTLSSATYPITYLNNFPSGSDCLLVAVLTLLRVG